MSNELEIILTKYANAVLDAKNGKTNPTLGELVDKPKQAIEAYATQRAVEAYNKGWNDRNEHVPNDGYNQLRNQDKEPTP